MDICSFLHTLVLTKNQNVIFMLDTMQLSSLSDEDLKEFEPTLEEGIQKEEKPEDKKFEDTNDKLEPGSLDEDFLNQEEEEEDKALEKEEKEEKPATPKKEIKKSDKQQVDLDFNAVYQKYVKQGTWVAVTDDEGNEVEINDEETFVKLMDWQVQNAADLALREREQEYGEQYQSFVHYLKSGGRIEDLANSFAQEKEIDEIDAKDLDGAEQIIEAYYESLGWDKQEIKDQIETLRDKGNDSFTTFAEKRKIELKKSIDSERQELIAKQEVEARRVKAYQEKYAKELKQAIHSQSIPEREKKELEKFYYEYKNPVRGGKASDFYIKFEETKQDPAKWLKVVQFIKDIDSFEKKNETKKQVVNSIFKSVRTGENIKDSQSPEAVKEEKSKAPTTFRRMFS